MEVIILCGGAGIRLQSVLPGRQKVLAKVKGNPVLGIIIDGLVQQGFYRIICATGIYSEQVRDYIRITHQGRTDREIVISEESEPLGTSGAVKNAERYINSVHFLVVNGDSFFRGVDYGAARRFHIDHGALVSLIVVSPRAEADYGAVEIAPDGRIVSFREKKGVGDLMSAGMYWMKKGVFGEMPVGHFSLEKDFFPRLTDGRLYGYVSSGEVHDIGTPERYARANEQGDT